ncbi:hypothetical protein [Xanthobacter autotrophicus]|uniref:hypothetical protein n=1 Tax=Xanthobacter autotrophicus TaxID=280 RepID=UPI0037299C02
MIIACNSGWNAMASVCDTGRRFIEAFDPVSADMLPPNRPDGFLTLMVFCPDGFLPARLAGPGFILVHAHTFHADRLL